MSAHKFVLQEGVMFCEYCGKTVSVTYTGDTQEEINPCKFSPKIPVPYQLCPMCNGDEYSFRYSALSEGFLTVCSVCEGRKIIPKSTQ